MLAACYLWPCLAGDFNESVIFQRLVDQHGFQEDKHGVCDSKNYNLCL